MTVKTAAASKAAALQLQWSYAPSTVNTSAANYTTTVCFSGIREAKLNGHVCPQHMYYKPDIWIGQEDCLWLNVYTRDLVIKKKRPVIVWIHGGNFVRGSAADYEPDYILDEDVVLVTIQYRYVNY